MTKEEIPAVRLALALNGSLDEQRQFENDLAVGLEAINNAASYDCPCNVCKLVRGEFDV